MHSPLHIYLVFNPFLNKNTIYPSQGHEFYYRLRENILSGDTDNSFMYWGKVSVKDSVELSSKEVNEIIELNESHGHDTHIYISDYHHFWVGKVSRAFKNIENKSHTLSFYDDKNVSTWFKITDFDLLSNQFEETLFYLSQLYCDNKYVDQKIDSLDPYVGNLTFPLVVGDRGSEKFFRNTSLFSGLRVQRENYLIAKPSLMSTVNEQVKSFVLKKETYAMLTQQVRDELVYAEASLLEEQDLSHKFSKVLVSYLRVFDSVVSKVYGDLLYSYHGTSICLDHKKDQFVEKSQSSNNQGETHVYHFVELLKNSKGFGNISFDKMISDNKELFDFFKGDLFDFICEFELDSKVKKIKNNIDLVVNADEVMKIRNKILGIGNIGLLNELASLKSN